MFGIALTLQATEILAGATLWFKVKQDHVKQILIFGTPQPTRIPILDAQLERLAGCPSKSQRAVSGRIVKVTRKLVNTKAFEHIITSLVNTKSEMHKKLQSSPIVRIP